MNPTQRILCIRLSALGDVINTLPALSALRAARPQAFIGYLVEDRAADLIRGHPAVDRVHLLPRRRWRDMLRSPRQWPVLWREIRAFRGELRAAGYDVVLDFQANLKGAVCGLLSGVSRRIGFARGYCKERNHWFNTEHVTPPGGELILRARKFLALAGALGARPEAARFELPASADSRQRLTAYSTAAGLARYAVIHPGTSGRGQLKRWPPERFGAVAAALVREQGLQVVVSWGPGEKPLAESVVAASGGLALLGPETGSVLDLAELLRNAALFIGCDSGPLHLASATGTPSVALFGPKDPRTYAPFNPRSIVLQKRQGSEPEGLGSMTAIVVADVLSAASGLLPPPAPAER